MSRDAEEIVRAALASLGAKAGEPVKSDDVTHALHGQADTIDALDLAEARGWLKPLGSEYLELTRKGYVASRLD